MGICFQHAALLTQADGNWMRSMGFRTRCCSGRRSLRSSVPRTSLLFLLSFRRAGQDGHERMKKKSISCCIDDLSFTLCCGLSYPPLPQYFTVSDLFFPATFNLRSGFFVPHWKDPHNRSYDHFCQFKMESLSGTLKTSFQ